MNRLLKPLWVATFVVPISTGLFSCKSDFQDDPLDNTKDESDSLSITIPSTTTDTILYATVNGDVVPIYLSIPKDCGSDDFPAIVLLHGSGGMWHNNDRDAGVMSRQNRDWMEIFNQNCVVGAYIDSYTPRGCIEREGSWKEAPDAFLISAQFVRPYDAYAGLDILRRLVREDGSFLVRHGDEGILGFSDGATALSATLYDTDVTPEGWQWRQDYDKEYLEADGVGKPANRPQEGGFACGVFYYGGSVGNSYWGGNPCSNPDFMYKNYAPILYQIPADDYLTENTLCALDRLESISALVEKYIYEDTDHGFDGDDGSQKQQSDLARIRTMEWFKEYLDFQEQN